MKTVDAVGTLVHSSRSDMYQKIKYDHESAELDAWKNLYGYRDYIVTGTVFSRGH